MFNSVLMVCVGNICRSPMAEAILAEALKTRAPGVVVRSAGIGALVDYPADATAQELMAERGIDISRHRARQVTASMAMEYDLILAMEMEHVRFIEKMQPSARGRVHLLGRWSDFVIPDPYRQPREAFEHAAQLIEQGVEEWISRIWA